MYSIMTICCGKLLCQFPMDTKKTATGTQLVCQTKSSPRDTSVILNRLVAAILELEVV